MYNHHTRVSFTPDNLFLSEKETVSQRIAETWVLGGAEDESGVRVLSSARLTDPLLVSRSLAWLLSAWQATPGPSGFLQDLILES